MATLRAAALLLNGLLILIGFWLVNRSAPRDASEFLIIGAILVAPVVNSVTVILQARKSN